MGLDIRGGFLMQGDSRGIKIVGLITDDEERSLSSPQFRSTG